jgi:hypothetical protein
VTSWSRRDSRELINCLTQGRQDLCMKQSFLFLLFFGSNQHATQTHAHTSERRLPALAAHIRVNHLKRLACGNTSLSAFIDILFVRSFSRFVGFVG